MKNVPQLMFVQITNYFIRVLQLGNLFLIVNFNVYNIN